MEVVARTRSAGKWNEDGYIATEYFFAVMDGATGLGEPHFEPTDAMWLVKSFVRDLNPGIEDLTGELQRLSRVYGERFAKKSDTKDPAEMPSMGLAMARVEEKELHLWMLGDVEIYLEEKDGTTLSFRDKNLPRIDEGALQEMRRIAEEKGITPREARPLIQDRLRENRRLMNGLGGYRVFSLPAAGAIVPFETKIPLEKVRFLALATDGILQAVDTFHLMDRKTLFHTPFRKIRRAILDASAKDPDFVEHPRFKSIDDMTLLTVTF